METNYPELEIGLHRVQADAYQVELRFLDPGSEAETSPRRAPCPLDPPGAPAPAARPERLWRLWDSRSRAALMPPLQHEKWVLGALFSADETRVLTWCGDLTVPQDWGYARLWDSRNGKALTRALKHEMPVNGAQFSADETTILTWSWDGSARVWDIAIDGDWPAQKIVLRTEVETGTTLTPSGEVMALSAADWQRKRWCEYDAIRHKLNRLGEAEWTESQRLCRNAQEEAPGP